MIQSKQFQTEIWLVGAFCLPKLTSLGGTTVMSSSGCLLQGEDRAVFRLSVLGAQLASQSYHDSFLLLCSHYGDISVNVQSPDPMKPQSSDLNVPTGLIPAASSSYEQQE